MSYSNNPSSGSADAAAAGSSDDHDHGHEGLDYSTSLTDSYVKVLDEVINLKVFLVSAPANFGPGDIMQRYKLPTEEHISCVYWNNVFYITGTDIVRCLHYRFEAFGRVVRSRKKFEEGIFSDLRSLKCDSDATLEEPKSEFLEFLYKNTCIRTQKKQKVFHWYSVKHDDLFLDALERDLKRESEGKKASTEAVGEPALSFKYDPSQSLADQLSEIINGIPKPLADIADASTSNKIVSRLREQQTVLANVGMELQPHPISQGASRSNSSSSSSSAPLQVQNRGPPALEHVNEELHNHSIPIGVSNFNSAARLHINDPTPNSTTAGYSYEMTTDSVPAVVGTSSGFAPSTRSASAPIHPSHLRSRAMGAVPSLNLPSMVIDEDEENPMLYSYREDYVSHIHNQQHQQQQQLLQQQQQQQLHQQQQQQQQRVFAQNSTDDYLYIKQEEDSDFPLDYLPASTGTTSMFSLGVSASNSIGGVGHLDHYDDQPDAYDSYVGADIRYNDEQMFLDTSTGSVGKPQPSTTSRFNNEMMESYMVASGNLQRIASNPVHGAAGGQYRYTDDYLDYPSGGQSGVYVPEAALSRSSGFRYRNDLAYQPMYYTLEELNGVSDMGNVINGLRKAVPHRPTVMNTRGRSLGSNRVSKAAAGGSHNIRQRKANDATSMRGSSSSSSKQLRGVATPPSKSSRQSPIASMTSRGTVANSAASNGSLLTVEGKHQYPTPSDSGSSERSYQIDSFDDLKTIRALQSTLPGSLDFVYPGFDDI